jgi:hypothetical protein
MEKKQHPSSGQDEVKYLEAVRFSRLLEKAKALPDVKGR